MISIVIPVYNVENYLLKCLDSCFTQSYVNIEVLAINDGSSDASGEILNSYAQKEKRLRVFHQANAGVVVARNIGIANAKGEWLMFVDSDDYIPEDSAKVLLETAIKSNAEIVSGILYNEYQGKSKKDRLLQSVGVSKCDRASALLSYQMHFSLSGKIFKSYLLNNIQTNSELKIGEDAFMVIQLCENANCITTIDNLVYCYVYRDSSVTHSPNKTAVESKLKFIILVIKYYSGKEYYMERHFQIALAQFIINESFGYICMGGDYGLITQELKRQLSDSLNNVEACRNIPKWRIIMFKVFNISPNIGRFYRFLFMKFRLLFR